MEQEEKELLLKDLCVRQPYGIKVKVRSNDTRTVRMVDTVKEIVHFAESDSISPFGVHIEHPLTFRQVIKPYLRPMSSMTEEEKLHLKLNYGFEFHGDVLSNLHIIKGGGFYEREGEYVEPTEDRQYTHITIDTVSELIKWLNSHHFDYRGLIPMGLALEALEGMY